MGENLKYTQAHLIPVPEFSSVNRMECIPVVSFSVNPDGPQFAEHGAMVVHISQPIKKIFNI